MSLNSIMGTAIGALQVNQSALKVTSGNVANVNTEGYKRRVVEFSPGMTGGALTGVAIAEIRRITDAYLQSEAVSSAGAAGEASVEQSYFDRVQSAIGALDGGASLVERFSDIAAALGQLAVDPASAARRSSTVSELQSALSAISGMAAQIQTIRQDANQELSDQLSKANATLTRISDLNRQVKLAVAQGDTATTLLDHRDRAIADLSAMMDIRTYEQPDGRVFVSLVDGSQLVGDLTAQFSYASPVTVTSATSFPEISLQRLSPSTGAPIGLATTLEGRLQGGSLRGLLDMRDKALPDLAEQLGAAAGALAESLNALHNGASSVPAANQLTGTNSGLVSTDALNFTGRTTLAVTDANGALVRRVAIDFGAGTLSVNGGGATAFGATVGGLTAALNTALGGDGSASFSGGVLTVSASASANGVSFVQDAAAPSARGGRSFAHVFGLNDLVQSSVRTSGDTGFAAGDAHGFTAGGQVSFSLRAPSGQVLTQGTYTIAGSTVADLVTGLNGAMGGHATVTLDAKGAMVLTPASGARMEINADTSTRGATGMSLSALFGLGTYNLAARAEGLSVRPDIAANPARFAGARLDIGATTAVGATVLGKSDNRAALDMAAALDAPRDWPAAGAAPAARMSVADYVAQLEASQGVLASAARSEADYRAGVAEEVQTRLDKKTTVNLDEELAQMIVFQQAYTAAARIMTTVQDMYDTLVSIKR